MGFKKKSVKKENSIEKIYKISKVGNEKNFIWGLKYTECTHESTLQGWFGNWWILQDQGIQGIKESHKLPANQNLILLCLKIYNFFSFLLSCLSWFYYLKKICRLKQFEL